jgi:uncharacterized membrane protein YvlD (DUF360 family)
MPGRIAPIALLDAAALLLAAALLSGFTTGGALSTIVLALAFGLANALVWPALARAPFPFTAATLALAALAVNVLVAWLGSLVLSGVAFDGLLPAAVVVLGLTALTTVVGGLLALDRGDLWDRHVVARQLRHTASVPKQVVPGLLLLEIDGLAHGVLRRALRNGDAPTLSRWLREDGYRLRQWETGWSSQTGACQAGLLHGDDHDWPAFRWWEKDRASPITTNHPRDAAELERRHSDGNGLLHADGASRANILSGDAPHSMLTMSTVLDLHRQGSLGEDYLAYFRSPLGVLRTVVRTVAELAIERAGARRQVRRDVWPRIDRHWSYALVRAYATVIQLDLQVAAVTADVLAGRPVVYTTFLAYDEVAHHSGIERADTLAILRRVDRAIARIADSVGRAPRPYRVVVLSDHGQSQGATFRQRYGEGLDELVARHGPKVAMHVDLSHGEGRAALDASLTELAERRTPTGHAVRTLARSQAPEVQGRPVAAAAGPPPEVSVMASGNLGLISFPREPGRATLEAIEARRPGLVDALRAHPGIAFVLVRSEASGSLVLGARGQRRLDTGATEGEDPLAPFGPNALAHVRRTDSFPHCPDLLVNSTYWAEVDEVAAFEELVGSHGGLGGGQAAPFVLHPDDLPWPSEPVVGAVAVHHVFRGWLAALGQQAYAEREAVPA